MTQEASQYAKSGVNLDVSDRITEKIGDLIEETRGPEVLSGRGAFGGLYDIGGLGVANPVLVASTDGVGTKVKLAAQCGSHESVGFDIVHHCIDDILVCGARPLFFLDYVGSGVLNPDTIPAVISGVAKACRGAGCALLGGETAEMPGMYNPSEYDLVGTIVGVVDKERILDGRNIKPGQVLLGLPSSGLHTNGYSLARRVLLDEGNLPLDQPIAGDERTLAEILLEPHRCYATQLLPLLEADLILGLAHITGGGFSGNVSRILPAGTAAHIDVKTWTPAPVFTPIQEMGKVSEAEMYRVFNMGIGMVAVIDKASSEHCLSACPGSVIIGSTQVGTGVEIEY
jgi:phosphoribosylformylglycinamidine cyclo-ligase